MDAIIRQRLTDIKSIQLEKLKIKFDITTLNMVISFIYKDSVLRTRKTLTHIYRLFNDLDMKLYEKDPELLARIWIIKTSLEGKLIKGLETDAVIRQYCLDDVNCTELSKKILLECENEEKPISHEESKYLIKKIEDTLEYGYIMTVKDTMMDILSSIDAGDFRSYKLAEQDLYDIATSIINIKRNASSLGSDNTFSLTDEIFENVVEEAVQKLKDRNRMFRTGISRLNTILAPAYMSKRLYLYLAFPGKGKSTILLKSALDIRKYNKGIKTKDPDKRPAVLFITLENDIAETVERIYNMTVDMDDIRNYTPKQIKKKLKSEGGLRLTQDDNIDIIIKEYKNREIDTNDLYTITNDLADEGIEVIALIVDYIKRIRPAERANDEKTELKNISNELKEYAKFWDCPVITAQQLNRSGASVVDAALQAQKEDVTRLVGRDAIAGAWELLENADWTCIINPEVKADTGELFLTFKLLKRRYRSTEENEKLRRLDYFNHPYEIGNEIKLIDDIDLPTPVSLESLMTKFEAVDESRGKTNAIERDTRDGKKKKKKQQLIVEDPDEFDVFSEDVAVNY